MRASTPTRRILFAAALRFAVLLALLHALAYALADEILTATSVLFSNLLRVLGEPHTREAHLILRADRGFLVVAECTAVFPVLLLVSATLALPGPFGRRLLAALRGALAVLVLNQTRLVSLWYAADHWPEAFRALHVFFRQPALMAAVVLIWWWWLVSPTRRAVR